MAERNVIWSDRKRTLFGLPLSFTKYILTEDRLFVQTGFFTFEVGKQSKVLSEIYKELRE